MLTGCPGSLVAHCTLDKRLALKAEQEADDQEPISEWSCGTIAIDIEILKVRTNIVAYLRSCRGFGHCAGQQSFFLEPKQCSNDE